MNLFKTFTKFDDGMTELITISPTIAKMFNGVYDEPEAVVKRMMESIEADFPTIRDDNYPNTQALSIAANQVGFKFPGQIAFGWRTRIDENNNVVYDFRLTINASYRMANNNIVAKVAKEKCWSEKTITTDKKENNSKNRTWEKKIERIERTECIPEE